VSSIINTLANFWLSPLWLLGLLAVTIPLVIHLFSKSKAPLISFAQFALIPIQQSRVANAMRIRQWLLLALRVFILIMLSLLLAQCAKPAKDNSKVEYLLVSNDWLATSNQQQKQTLLNRFNQTSDTSERRLVRLGLNKLNTVIKGTNNDDYISSEQGLLTLSVLNPDKVTKQHSVRPQLTIWQQVADFYATHTTITPANIQVFTTDRLALFDNEQVAVPAQIKWHILKKENAAKNSLKSTILLLLTQKNQEQADYIRAALSAINTQREHKIQFDLAQLATFSAWAELSRYDWIFYLANGQPSTESRTRLSQYVQGGGQLLLVAADALEQGNWQVSSNISSPANSDIKLTQMGEPPKVLLAKKDRGADTQKKEVTKVIWQTDEGQTVLDSVTDSHSETPGQVLRFHSRFEPNWSNWVTQLDFPFTLDSILNRQAYRDEFSTNARLHTTQITAGASQAQLPPISQNIRLSKALNRQREKSNHHWLLIMLVGAFCLERVWAEFGVKTSRVDGRTNEG
tara:strand:- start:6471 stop:8015 length:1545 start_codon:yes stop_codon:yes gene_type:complete